MSSTRTNKKAAQAGNCRFASNAQALLENASRRCLIDGIEKHSKYQLQAPPYPDLIWVMQRHPSPPSIRQVFRAAIEKILRDPTHPQYTAFKKEFAKYQSGGGR